MDLLTAARRVKPQNLFLNESLTPQRQNISYGLRKAKRENPNIISGTSTFDGRVYVWVKPPNSDAPDSRDVKITLNSYVSFENFCSRWLKKPMDTYISNYEV